MLNVIVRFLVFGIAGPLFLHLGFHAANWTALGIGDLSSLRLTYTVTAMPALLIACVDQYFAKDPSGWRVVKTAGISFLGIGLLLGIAVSMEGFLIFGGVAFALAIFCSLLTDLILRMVAPAKSA